MAASAPSLLLILLSSLVRHRPASSFVSTPPRPTRSVIARTMSTSADISGDDAQRRRRDDIYPRALHPGGLSLPPLVEDRLSIVTYHPIAPPISYHRGESIGDANYECDDESSFDAAAVGGGGGARSSSSSSSSSSSPRADLLLVKPPDMESLWEWYAYTRRQTDADPSWGRIWPTALSLSRWILRALSSSSIGDDDAEEGDGRAGSSSSSSLMTRAERAIRNSNHAIELGCGLGVVGLAYASAISSTTWTEEDDHGSGREGQRVGRRRRRRRRRRRLRTITFLDREPYALHCVMASASVNRLATGPMTMQSPRDDGTSSTVLTVRASVDDWTAPPTATTDTGDEDGPSRRMAKNVGFMDLHLGDDDDDRGGAMMLILASDVLYEPMSMESLSNKLLSLVHPTRGGYALIADPRRERTIGCRDAFVECVRSLGGEVEVFPLPDLDEERRMMMSDNGNDHRVTPSLLVGGVSDVDIDGSLAKTMLIVVHYPRGKDGI